MQSNILFGCKQSDAINDLSNNVPYGRYTDEQLAHLEAQVEAGLITSTYDQHLFDHIVGRMHQGCLAETLVYSKTDHNFNITLGKPADLWPDDIGNLVAGALNMDTSIAKRIQDLNVAVDSYNVECEAIYSTSYRNFVEKVVVSGIIHNGRKYPVHVYRAISDGSQPTEVQHIFPVQFSKEKGRTVNIRSHLTNHANPFCCNWGGIDVTMSPSAWVTHHITSRFSTLGIDKYDMPVIPFGDHETIYVDALRPTSTGLDELVATINTAIYTPFRVDGPLYHIWYNLGEFNGDDSIPLKCLIGGYDASGVVLPNDHLYIREMTDCVINFNDHNFDVRVVAMWDGSESLIIDVKDPYRYNSNGPDFILTGKVVERLVNTLNSELHSKGCGLRTVVRKVYNPGVTGRGYPRPGLDLHPFGQTSSRGLILLGLETGEQAPTTFSTENINSILELLGGVC